MKYQIRLDKDLSAAEFGILMESVGWGNRYNGDDVRRSLSAYPFIAHARDGDGRLIGYVSAFSDGAFSTMLGELVVHPSAQRQGIGKALLNAVERAYPNVPVYAKPLKTARDFFSHADMRCRCWRCACYSRGIAIRTSWRLVMPPRWIDASAVCG